MTIIYIMVHFKSPIHNTFEVRILSRCFSSFFQINVISKHTLQSIFSIPPSLVHSSEIITDLFDHLVKRKNPLLPKMQSHISEVNYISEMH